VRLFEGFGAGLAPLCSLSRAVASALPTSEPAGGALTSVGEDEQTGQSHAHFAS